jgi:predicted ATPase
MFTRVEVQNFRSLKDVSVPLSNFHVLVGPNGSGKTTFLDVFAFMRDLLDSDGIAGALRKREIRWEDLVFHGEKAYSVAFAFEALIPESVWNGSPSPLRKFDSIRYKLEFHKFSNSKEVRVVKEICHLFHSSIPRTLLDWTPPIDQFYDAAKTIKALPEMNAVPIVDREGEKCFAIANDTLNQLIYTFSNGSLALEKIPEDLNQFPVITWLKNQFRKFIQPIELQGEKLRIPSTEEITDKMIPDGSNLPWLIHSLKEEFPDRYQDWIWHLTTGLTNIVSIETIPSADQREMYLEIEYDTGVKAKSWMISDGTLRLLALTLIAYHPNLTGLFLIEEPENGIHPLAIETVFASISHMYDSQAFVTTHSPLVLSLVKVRDLLCFSKNPDGSNTVIIGTQHPSLVDWKDNANLSILFASGILD